MLTRSVTVQATRKHGITDVLAGTLQGQECCPVLQGRAHRGGHHAFAGALAVDVAEVDCQVVALLAAAQCGQAFDHGINLCPPGTPGRLRALNARHWNQDRSSHEHGKPSGRAPQIETRRPLLQQGIKIVQQYHPLALGCGMV